MAIDTYNIICWSLNRFGFNSKAIILRETIIFTSQNSIYIVYCVIGIG